MLKTLIPVLICAILAMSVPVDAATAVSVFSNPGAGDGSKCIPTREVIAVATALAAGQVDVCFYSNDEEVRANSVMRVAFDASGPGLIGATAATYTPTFNAMVGCTGSAWTVVTNNVASGSGASGTATITMTSHDCSGYFRLSITSSSPLVPNIADAIFPINIHVPNQYSLTYLCNASGTTPEAFDAAVNACTAPTVNLGGSLTINGIPDTQQEIQAIADALAAGLDVTICPETTPCYQVLSGGLAVTGVGNVSTTVGNTTVTFPDIIRITPALVMTSLFILLVALAEWKQDAMWFILAALAGVVAISSGEFTGNSTITLIIAAIVYCIYRSYQTMRQFSPRRSDDGDEGDDN